MRGRGGGCSLVSGAASARSIGATAASSSLTNLLRSQGRDENTVVLQ